MSLLTALRNAWSRVSPKPLSQAPVGALDLREGCSRWYILPQEVGGERILVRQCDNSVELRLSGSLVGVLANAAAALAVIDTTVESTTGDSDTLYAVSDFLVQTATLPEGPDIGDATFLMILLLGYQRTTTILDRVIALADTDRPADEPEPTDPPAPADRRVSLSGDLWVSTGRAMLVSDGEGNWEPVPQVEESVPENDGRDQRTPTRQFVAQFDDSMFDDSMFVGMTSYDSEATLREDSSPEGTRAPATAQMPRKRKRRVELD